MATRPMCGNNREHCSKMWLFFVMT